MLRAKPPTESLTGQGWCSAGQSSSLAAERPETHKQPLWACGVIWAKKKCLLCCDPAHSHKNTPFWVVFNVLSSNALCLLRKCCIFSVSVRENFIIHKAVWNKHFYTDKRQHWLTNMLWVIHSDDSTHPSQNATLRKLLHLNDRLLSLLVWNVVIHCTVLQYNRCAGDKKDTGLHIA